MGNINIELVPMTRELCHVLFKEWEMIRIFYRIKKEQLV